MKPFRIVTSPKAGVSASAIRTGADERNFGVMLDVIIALLPALAWGIIVYGPRAAVIAGICVASSVLFEFLYCFVTGKQLTIGDLSAVVTGLILSMTLPTSVSLYLPVLGTFFAIIVIKELFGGIGNNWLNPAVSARLLLFIWPEQTAVYPKAFTWLPAFSVNVSEEAAATAVPTALDSLNQLLLPEEHYFDLLLGKCAGSVGEISFLLLLAGGIYLAIRKVINFKVPLTYIAALGLAGFLFPFALRRWDTAGAELLSGSAALVAFFCVCDYSTTPLSGDGKLIFAAGAGILTFVFRQLGLNIDGAYLALLAMNVLARPIDFFLSKKPRGYKKKNKKKDKTEAPAPAAADAAEPSAEASNEENS